METPKHLERHRQVYERHMRGESFSVIGRDMGISRQRARELALLWRRHLRFLRRVEGFGTSEEPEDSTPLIGK